MALPKINGLFRLTRDCEIQYSASGTAVAKLGLAASEKYKDKETKLFIDAVAFAKTGEILQQYAGLKGTQIYLSGKLQLDQWQDKNTGENRSKTTMVIESFDFVSGQNPGHQAQQQPMQNKQQANQQAQNFQQPQQAPMQQQAPQQQYMPNQFDDDVNF